jgi:hypothetical protein
MSAQREISEEDINYVMSLVREHWPEVFDYNKGVANIVLRRINEIAVQEGVAAVTPARLVGLRELYAEHFYILLEIERTREWASTTSKICRELNEHLDKVYNEWHDKWLTKTASRLHATE